ncbi:penicillin-binding protein 1A [Algimonas ampicilliniresistens]|uniref:peptidoglycan glycosyltransferase n=1 Tax=Algimonas ampicilliniresistens TaxID=1298735 RepID=A0ABQ5V9P4_9PROT|nr:PBP1A family penicillin-binding protein [Algimonas ampicilliniresistens]GLQ23459.1 penicillin-binding protein 1A [Algimonas ampicilliniresistens]
MATYRADINVEQTSNRRRRSAWVLGILAFLTVSSAAAFGLGRAYLLDGMPDLPDKETMWQLNLQDTITLIDHKGRMIGHRGPWIGQPLKLNEMPAHLPNAVLAIEDERFFEHEGVDNRAIIRAMLSNARSGQRSQGGSTLTQQLVKLMILTPEKTYRRKFQEALLARDMEAILSKPEILELYVNRVSLGPQIFGAEAGSQIYFGKSARDLNLAEAAMLAGLAQAPSRFNPTRHYERALTRSHLVLRRMRANVFITEAEYEAALANPPEIAEEPNLGLDEAILGYAFDYIAEQARDRAGLRHPDLVVTTTLDADYMQQAHKSLNKIIDQSGKSRRVAQGALVTLDNETGGIRAMIGGRDYVTSKFNRSIQAQRQPGSSFKTFVYAAALEDGFTPATVRVDQPTNINGWQPKNYTLRYRGPLTLREALKLSINTVAAKVGAEIGADRIAETAERFGINSPLRPHLSLALGVAEVNLLELSSAYSVFPNEGLRRRPYIIQRIETTSGEEIYAKRNTQGERVYPVPYARQMTSILQETVESGTAHGARMLPRIVAGKTGTSQDYRDAWFMGFTNQLTSGVWMGNDNNSPMNEVTGGLLPVDVWKDYMSVIHEGLPQEPLAAPDLTRTDERASEVMAFYSRLAAAMRSERDIASGVGGGGVSAGR